MGLAADAIRWRTAQRLERNLGLPTWLPIVVGVAAVAVAAPLLLDARGSAPEAAWLALAALPFVVEALGVRLPALAIGTVLVPVGILTFEGGDRLAFWLSAMAVLRVVPEVPRLTGAMFTAVAATLPWLVAATQGDFTAWPLVSAGMAAAWCAGWSFGRVLDHLRQLQYARARFAEDAARAERRRLARELHDLVAHALTGTMLYLAEARLELGSDLDAAMEALDGAERLARLSLADLRRTVRLLSERGDPAMSPPTELESDVSRMVEGYRRAGVGVSFELSGTPAWLSVTTAWAVYRIVQESVTNAVRHAPGTPVDVRIACEHERVSMTIVNGRSELDPPCGTADPGHGLAGMCERAALLGGRVEAGPTRDGWLVSGWIPVTAPAAVALS